MSNLLCCLFGHKYELKRVITPTIREVKCKRCNEEFGMNDTIKSVLSLDQELKSMHDAFLNMQAVNKAHLEKILGKK